MSSPFGGVLGLGEELAEISITPEEMARLQQVQQEQARINEEARQKEVMAQAHHLDSLFTALYTPEQIEQWNKAGAIGFSEALERTELYDYIPYLSTALNISEDWQLLGAIEELKKQGENGGDQSAALENLRQMCTQMAEVRYRGMDVWGKIASGIPGSLSFMGEFAGAALTVGAATGATATAQGGRTVASAALRTAIKGFSQAAATAALMPTQIASNYIGARVDQIAGTTQVSEDGKVTVSDPQASTAMTLLQAYGDVLVAVIAEKSGGVIGDGASKAGAELLKLMPDGLQTFFTNAAQIIRPGETAESVLNTIGVHGILSEIGENRLEGLLSIGTGLDDFPADIGTAQKVQQVLLPGWETLAVEFGTTFATVGAARTGTSAALAAGLAGTTYNNGAFMGGLTDTQYEIKAWRDSAIGRYLPLDNEPADESMHGKMERAIVEAVDGIIASDENLAHILAKNHVLLTSSHSFKNKNPIEFLSSFQETTFGLPFPSCIMNISYSYEAGNLASDKIKDDIAGALSRLPDEIDAIKNLSQRTRQIIMEHGAGDLLTDDILPKSLAENEKIKTEKTLAAIDDMKEKHPQAISYMRDNGVRLIPEYKPESRSAGYFNYKYPDKITLNTGKNYSSEDVVLHELQHHAQYDAGLLIPQGFDNWSPKDMAIYATFLEVDAFLKTQMTIEGSDKFAKQADRDTYALLYMRNTLKFGKPTDIKVDNEQEAQKPGSEIIGHKNDWMIIDQEAKPNDFLTSAYEQQINKKVSRYKGKDGESNLLETCIALTNVTVNNDSIAGYSPAVVSMMIGHIGRSIDRNPEITAAIDKAEGNTSDESPEIAAARMERDR